MAENGVPGSGNAVLLVHRVSDPSERQKDRQRTGLLHVAISHAAVQIQRLSVSAKIIM